jgi:two-component system sensor histidine kinase KdpD
MEDIRLTAEEEAELVETIEISADRLDALVANLLDMSRLQTGSLRAGGELVEPSDVIAAALTAVGDAASAITVTVDPDAPPALADFGLVERVLANLVENALRYAAGGPITVTASTVEDRVEFRVVDHGPGVAPEDRGRIFLPFQRLGDSVSRSGVGLGLAVATGFAEAMGGALTAEDTPGGGLTMVLALPVAVGPEGGASDG